MTPGLHPGHAATLTRVVDPSQTITLGDAITATVFSTPAMVDLMEHAAREALRPFLEEGEESVGIDVKVEHLAATPLGAEVHATAAVTAIEGNVVTFDVTAHDPWAKIGRGTHRRAVIQTGRFAAKLAEKEPSAGASNDDLDFSSLRTLETAADGPVLTVTLNRPRKRNAINQEMTADLERLTAWLAGRAAQVRVVILTGAGGAFSAGDDITDLNLDDPEAARALSLRRARLYDRWLRLPQVLIAAVSGPALGGGCVCAYSCDLRVAAHDATFGLPEIKLGWPPNYGLARLISLVGKSRATELILTAATLTAREAHACGLVHQLATQGNLLSAARRLADRLLSLPPLALAEAKSLLAHDAPGTALDREATQSFARSLKTADAREGVQAFVEKRAARFRSL